MTVKSNYPETKRDNCMEFELNIVVFKLRKILNEERKKIRKID